MALLYGLYTGYRLVDAPIACPFRAHIPLLRLDTGLPPSPTPHPLIIRLNVLNCCKAFSLVIMKLADSVLSDISLAKTPEEAYKIFAASASKLIAEAVAQSISEAVGSASGLAATNPSIAGWDKYVSGVTLSGCWGTPGVLSQPSSLITFSDFGDPGILGGRITCGGEWSF
jgi:hypothetical protein